MNKKVKVCVVDTGVFTTHKLLKKYEHISGIGVQFEKDKIVLKDDFLDNYGHGTAINQIIKSHCPDCEIFNIKLFENEDVNEDELIQTLEYICDNVQCDILNLSLGVCILNNYDRLYNICEKLKNKGVIIVSAFDNNEALSYPASFDNVIGVSNSIEVRKNTDYIFNEGNIINIFAYGAMQRLAWIKPELLMLQGNSFACPHIVGIIANIFKEKRLKFNELLEKLKENAQKIIKIDEPKKSVFNKFFDIKNAVIFPFNKEMHSLIRYYNILKFNIVDVYDSKYSFNVSASTRHLLKDDNVQDIVVKNYENMDFSKFDTIILGHMDELSNLINKKELKKEIIIEVLKNKKNIYAFDDLSEYKEIIEKYNTDSKIFCPIVSKENMPEYTFGKLYKHSKPIVSICGTSSRQGKFTVQLGIRREMLKQGYDLGQIGTEPSALLYGMDYVYPLGYNSSVYLSQKEQIIYTNSIVNELCKKDIDIVITGCQSNMVSYEITGLSFMPTTQFNFILGINPDATILCVNVYDDIKYIKRTINFIESICECKVLSLVVFPMTIKGDWTSIYSSKRKITDEEYSEFKNNVQKEVNLPIYNLDNKNCFINLVENITDFFV